MARLSTYLRDKTITGDDKLSGSSYEGEGISGPIYKTRSYKLSDLNKYFSNNVVITIDDINYDLEQLNGIVISTEEKINTLTDAIGEIDLDGTLINISADFANNLADAITNIPQDLANSIFDVADITEAFANSVFNLSTTVNDTIQDSLDGLAQDILDLDALVDTNAINIQSNVSSINDVTGEVQANASNIVLIGTSINTLDASVVALGVDITTLESTVNQNTGDISSTATDLEALTTTVTTANASITALASELTILETTVDGNTGSIQSNATDIDTLTTTVNTANANITSLATDITALETRVDGNTGDITANATDISTLGTRVTTSDANILNVQSDLTALTTEVDGNTGDISTNATSISALVTAVDTAEADINAAQANITTLQTDVNNAEGNISVNAANISTLVTSIQTADAQIGAIQGDITTLQADINTAEGNISTNATNISSLGTSISTANTNITNLQTNVTNLTSTVNTNTGNISSNASSINTLSSRITSNDSDISAISTNVTSLTTSVNNLTGDISAVASDVSTLETTVDDNTASITQTQTSIDGIEAQYTVKVEANGTIAGLELLAGGTGPETNGTSFIAQADEFGVNMPTGNRIFTVDNTGGTFNGSVTAGNVTVQEDLITFGTTSAAYADAGKLDFRNRYNQSVGNVTVNAAGSLQMYSDQQVAITSGVGVSKVEVDDGSVYLGNISNNIIVDTLNGIKLDGDLTFDAGYEVLNAGNMSGNGYQILQNGLIIQWIRRTGVSNKISGLWPTEFPTYIFGAVVSKGFNSSQYDEANNAATVSYTNLNYYVDVNDTGRTIFIIALGF